MGDTWRRCVRHHRVCRGAPWRQGAHNACGWWLSGPLLGHVPPAPDWGSPKAAGGVPDRQPGMQLLARYSSLQCQDFQAQGPTQEGGADTSQQVEDPYANEPERHRALLVRTEQPFNAETPPELLTDTPTTPNEFFYVRNHLPVPHVDPAHYSVCYLLTKFVCHA